MVTVIIPPNRMPRSRFSVFLGGAIDMGNAANWQASAIEMFTANNARDLVVLNPRRDHFRDEQLDQQIKWELAHLEKSNVILMWFPANSDAPISLLETGLYMTSGKLVIGAEPGFSRRRNLELTCEHYEVRLWDNLSDVVGEVYERHLLWARTPYLEHAPSNH